MSGLTNRPYCRCCGGRIAKRFFRIDFGEQRADRVYENWERRTERPATREEAARFSNYPLVTARKSYSGEYIGHATYWDGESYADPHFCKNVCAEAFGRMAAREYPRLRTMAAAEAEDARAALTSNSGEVSP